MSHDPSASSPARPFASPTPSSTASAFLPPESAQARQQRALARFVREKLVPEGFRVVATSRPEGIDPQPFLRRFVVLELRRLSGAQALAFMKSKLEHSHPVGLELASHVTNLLRCRKAQDALFSDLCPLPDERERIESFGCVGCGYISDIDRRDHRRVPAFQVQGAEGERCAAPREVPPLLAADALEESEAEEAAKAGFGLISRHLQGLARVVRPSMLAAVDAILDGLEGADAPPHAWLELTAPVAFPGGTVEEESAPAKRLAELEQLKAKDEQGLQLSDGEPQRLVELMMSHEADRKALDEWRLARRGGEHVQALAELVMRRRKLLERMQPPAGDKQRRGVHGVLMAVAPHTSCVALWPCILARTDEIYAAAEEFLPHYEDIMRNLSQRVGLQTSALDFASALDTRDASEPALFGLKSPVRLHEKAFDESEDWEEAMDDVRSGLRAAESYAASDVVRCRAMCDEVSQMIGLVEALEEGFEVGLPGGVLTRITLVHVTNTFGLHGTLEPTRHRYIDATLQLTVTPALPHMSASGTPSGSNKLPSTTSSSSCLCELQIRHADIFRQHITARADEHYNFCRQLQRACCTSAPNPASPKVALPSLQRQMTKKELLELEKAVHEREAEKLLAKADEERLSRSARIQKHESARVEALLVFVEHVRGVPLLLSMLTLLLRHRAHHLLRSGMHWRRVGMHDGARGEPPGVDLMDAEFADMLSKKLLKPPQAEVSTWRDHTLEQRGPLVLMRMPHRQLLTTTLCSNRVLCHSMHLQIAFAEKDRASLKFEPGKLRSDHYVKVVVGLTTMYFMPAEEPHGTRQLPTDVYELFEQAMATSAAAAFVGPDQRRSSSDSVASGDASALEYTHESGNKGTELVALLTKIADVNQRAVRVLFHDVQVDAALGESSGTGWTETPQRALWNRMHGDGFVPLVAIREATSPQPGRRALEHTPKPIASRQAISLAGVGHAALAVADATTARSEEAAASSTCYFRCRSFQEALFAQHLVATAAQGLVGWQADESASVLMTNAWLQDTLRIGGSRLGLALAKLRKAWDLGGAKIGDAGMGVIAPLIHSNTALQQLELSSCGLSGASGPILDAALGGCKSLQSLRLNHNCFSGPIPGNLPHSLRDLILCDNQFTGVLPGEALGKCLALRVLDASRNRLTGPLPGALGQCKELVSLCLSENQLTGEVSSELGNCRHLERLVLTDNQFCSLPDSLGACKAMREMLIGHNRLSGPLASSLGRLVFLERLVLSYNDLCGTIPDTIGNCRSLVQLQLQGNSFDGVLPVEALSRLTRLAELKLSGNQLHMPVPKAVRELPCLVDFDLLYLRDEDQVHLCRHFSCMFLFIGLTQPRCVVFMCVTAR